MKLKKMKSGFAEFCRENRKITEAAVSLVVFLFFLQLFQGYFHRPIYITDHKGNLIGIQRDADAEISSVPLKIKAKKGELVLSEEILLSLGKEQEKDDSAAASKGESSMSELKRRITGMKREIEENAGEVIKLPQTLDDGTKLSWKKPKNFKPVSTLLLLPMILFFFYRNEKEKEAKQKTLKMESVKQSLPAFNNQMLLLLHSGMIFSDAFDTISEGYAVREKSGYFGEVIWNLYQRSRESEKSTVTLLEECAKQMGSREFSRFVSIVADNQYKGVNLTEKLEEESRLLWDQRKKLAEEKGRMTETKLSFPLAVLLLVLILITASPAVLQM